MHFMLQPYTQRNSHDSSTTDMSHQLLSISHLQAMGAAEREGPVQGRLYRSLKLWTFYCDLEESLGTPESTRAAYDRIMELRIATPQIVLNYAAFLQVCYWFQHRLLRFTMGVFAFASVGCCVAKPSLGFNIT